MLSILERLTLNERKCNAHFSRFLVAELNGAPVGALTAFDPAESDLLPLVSALTEIPAKSLRETEAIERAIARIEMIRSHFPRSEAGIWTIEWVAVEAAHRNRGICGALIQAILAEGARRRCRSAQVSTYIGNHAAVAAYERAGFLVVNENRSPEFEALLGAPGLWIMRRDLTLAHLGGGLSDR